MDYFTIDRDASDSAFNALYKRLQAYNLVVAGLLNSDMRVSKHFGITDNSISFLNRLADSSNVILDVFANPYVLERFGSTAKYKAIIESYEDKDINQELSAQLIFGGIPSQGILPVKASEEFYAGTGLLWNSTIRVKYTIPEELGIDSKALMSIDTLVNAAIRAKALPGCVIYLAKDGKVFYNKAFGYLTYDSLQKTQTNDVYDLASITKIAATTPSLMMLYDQKKINLNDRLSKFLPELNKTKKNKITIKEVMAHQARLISSIPFYLRTLQCLNPKEQLVSRLPSGAKSYKVNESSVFINCNTRYRDSIFSNIISKTYSVPVADSLFTRKEWHDSIYNIIYHSEMLPKTTYVYSDLGFMLLSEAIVKYTGQAFDKLLDSTLYRPLGAYTLGFNPLRKLEKSKIAPTENDVVFRKQLVRGTVHDPAAALLGGVSGHAGLFATANDLGKLMQLYLNKGEYGGQRYFASTTVDLFTRRPFAKTGNRRALGFDKPEPNTAKQSPVSSAVSDDSYGHTGFTGTMTWVDPASNLVYVFLSNRVCPDAGVNKLAELNLRTNIQDIVYKAIKSSK
jgi:beta-N-acetylhexosaminidase